MPAGLCLNSGCRFGKTHPLGKDFPSKSAQITDLDKAKWFASSVCAEKYLLQRRLRFPYSIITKPSSAFECWSVVTVRIVVGW